MMLFTAAELHLTHNTCIVSKMHREPRPPLRGRAKQHSSV